MSFGAQVRGWTVQVRAENRAAVEDIVREVHRSVQSGSELTNSPGQPVDTGKLRQSIQTMWESVYSAIVGVWDPEVKGYAAGIENQIGPHGPLKLRSKVGGFHSFKRTASAFDRLVAAVLARRRRA